MGCDFFFEKNLGCDLKNYLTILANADDFTHSYFFYQAFFQVQFQLLNYWGIETINADTVLKAAQSPAILFCWDSREANKPAHSLTKWSLKFCW